MKQVPIIDHHKVINESFRGMKMVSLHVIYLYIISHVPLFIFGTKRGLPKMAQDQFPWGYQSPDT